MMTLQICSIWLVVLQTIKASIRVLRCLLETRINKINQNSSKRLLLTMKMMVSASSKRQLKSQNRMKIAEIELLKKLLQATSSSISSLIIWTVSKFRSATLIIAVVWLGDRSAIYLHRRALALNNYSSKVRRGVSTHPGPKASSLIKRCIMRSSKKKADPVVYWRQFKPSSWSIFSSCINRSWRRSIWRSGTIWLRRLLLIYYSTLLKEMLVATSSSCYHKVWVGRVSHSRLGSAINRPWTEDKTCESGFCLRSWAILAHSLMFKDPVLCASSTLSF